MRRLLLLVLPVLAAGCGAHTSQPSGTLAASATEIFLTETVTLTVQLDRKAPGGGFTFPVFSSNDNTLSVPATVTVPGGSDSTTVIGTGLAVGGSIVVTVRFPDHDASVTVSVLSPPAISLTAVTNSAQQFTTGTLVVSGTATHARALDAASAIATTDSSNGVTFGAIAIVGSASAFELQIPYVIAVDAPPGSVTVDVDTNGPDLGAHDTFTFDVIRIPRVSTITPATATIDTTEFRSFLVTLDLPARAGGEQVALLSGNAAKVDAPAMVVVSAGLMSANVDLQGVSTGGPIAVVGTLADSNTMTSVTVQDATITVPVVTGGGSGYQGQMKTLTATGTGSSYVAVNPATFTLTAPGGSGLTLSNASLTGNAAGWTLSVDVAIDAAAASGTVNLAFDANGATPGAMRNVPFTVLSLPKVFSVGPDGTNVDVGSSATLTVTLDVAAGPGDVIVSLSSDSSNVTVPASVTVLQGATQATFSATGHGEGTATILASLNGGSDTTLVQSVYQQQGQVIFTEFVTLTATTSNNAGERIELLNLTGSPITIDGWTFQTSSSGSMTVHASSPIPGGGLFVGMANPTGSIPVGIDFVWGDPGVTAQIGNSAAGDRLRLLDTQSIPLLQDQVDFRGVLSVDALGASTFPGSFTHSTQLASTSLSALANDDGGKWCTTFHTADSLGFPNQDCAGVLINEVLYDATGTDNGNLFVELAGNGGGSIGGLKLKQVSATGTVQNGTVTAGVRMPADGFYVVADGVTGMTGVTTVANADQVVQTFDPANTAGSAVQLLTAASVVIDSVQYGLLVGTNGEGTPTPVVASGHSISRDANSTDTNDNSVDFTDHASPSPGS